MTNPHEELARNRKVFRLVEAIDREMDRQPAKRMARALRNMDIKFWRGLALHAKVRPPSEETIEEVCRVYERRAAAS